MAVFFHDTDGELWFTKAQELGIDKNVIRMPYILNGKEYFADLGETYDAKDFFKQIRNGATAVTAALNPNDYVMYFEPFFEAGEDIFYVAFSSEMSATFNNLEIALKELKEKYPKTTFTRFDTKAISASMAVQVCEAAKMHNAGKSVDEIVAFLSDFSPRVNMFVVADDLQYLKRGGRLSAVQAAIGGLLKIKPIIKLNKQGKLFAAGKASGKNKAYAMVADEVAEQIADVDKYEVYLLDADCKEDADYLEELIKERVPNVNIFRQPVGPVIGAHAGPGTVGVCFVGKDRPD
jgi:DegV family protein with EDD domain